MDASDNASPSAQRPDEALTPGAMTALSRGRGIVDLTGWRKALVTGADAPAWLNDLLAADLSGRGKGQSRRSLLLSPTGRVRADVTVARLSRGHLLIQDRRQPEAVADVLAPYVLSSDVAIEDRTAALALLALPGRPEPSAEVPPGWEALRPSCLGPGVDLVGPAEGLGAVRDRLLAGRASVAVDEASVEAWRVRRGFALFPVDLTSESLPHEADVGPAVAFDKGCYLGQEAVARVRNLGHPPFVLLAMRANRPVEAGEPVLARGEEAGTVTSSALLDGGEAAVIARIRWKARDQALRTPGGALLRPVGRAIIPSASAASA